MTWNIWPEKALKSECQNPTYTMWHVQSMRPSAQLHLQLCMLRVFKPDWWMSCECLEIALLKFLSCMNVPHPMGTVSEIGSSFSFPAPVSSCPKEDHSTSVSFSLQLPLLTPHHSYSREQVGSLGMPVKGFTVHSTDKIFGQIWAL